MFYVDFIKVAIPACFHDKACSFVVAGEFILENEIVNAFSLGLAEVCNEVNGAVRFRDGP